MTPERELRIVFDQAGGAEAQLVRDRLDLFNVGVTGVSAYYPVHFFLKSERGETMGGLLGAHLGRLAAYHLSLDGRSGARQALGDPPDGPGRSLCPRARCHSATLDTHSFQARPFYEGAATRSLARSTIIPRATRSSS